VNFEVALCLKCLATAPQPFPRSPPSFNTTRGSLAPDRGTGSELTAAPLPPPSLTPLPHQSVKSKLQVDLTSIFHFLTVSFCISRSKNITTFYYAIQSTQPYKLIAQVTATCFDLQSHRHAKLRTVEIFKMWLCAFGFPDGLQRVLLLATCIYIDQ